MSNEINNTQCHLRIMLNPHTMANKDRGLTQSPNQPSVAPTHSRPGMHVGDGQRRYCPAVDRLMMNPIMRAMRTGFLASRFAMSSQNCWCDRCSTFTMDHQRVLLSSIFNVSFSCGLEVSFSSDTIFNWMEELSSDAVFSVALGSISEVTNGTTRLALFD